MSQPIRTNHVHHLTLTVSDVRRSVDFYTRLLGFQIVMELGPRVLLANGVFILVLTPPPDQAQAIPGDSFNENRIGLDHLSLRTDSREDLEEAHSIFTSQGVSHGEIKDLGPDLGIFVLAFRDPDNIQLELSAPYFDRSK